MNGVKAGAGTEISLDSSFIENTPKTRATGTYESTLRSDGTPVGYINDRETTTPPSNPKIGTLKALAGTALHALIDKISDGVYQSEDKDGKQVIDHLIEIAKPEYKEKYLQPMIERTLECGVSTQDQHGSCGAESLIRIFNVHDVGEWARVAKELITQNYSELRFGEPLEVPPDARQIDASADRTPFDRLLQSAFMNAAAPRNMEYSNQKQKFVDTLTKTIEEEGTVDAAAARLLNGFTSRMAGCYEPQKHSRVTSEIAIGGCLVDALVNESKGPPSKPMYIVLKWPDGADLHAVVLKGQDGKGNILFSNPHGAVKDAAGNIFSDGSQLSYPSRMLVNNSVGLQSMTRADFERHFTNVILPELKHDSAEKTDLWKSVEVYTAFEQKIGGELSKIENKCVTKPEEILRDRFFFDRDLERRLTDVAVGRDSTQTLFNFLGLNSGVPEEKKAVDKLVTAVKEALEARDVTSRDEKLTEVIRVVMNSPKMEEMWQRFLNANRGEIIHQIEAKGPANVSALAKQLTSEQKTLAGYRPAGTIIGGVPMPEGFQRLEEFTAKRVELALRAEFEAKVRDVVQGIGKKVLTDQLFRVPLERVNIEQIMSIASASRSKNPGSQTDIPAAFGQKTYQGFFSISRMFGMATIAASAVGVLAGPVVPGLFMLGAGLSFVNLIVAGPKNQGYSWQKFERRSGYASYPSDAELLAALVATLHGVRGEVKVRHHTPPIPSEYNLSYPLRDGDARDAYRQTLVKAMTSLVGADGNVSAEADQKKQQARHQLMMELSQAARKYEQAGFGGYLDTANRTLCFGSNLVVGVARFVLLGF